jgi:hypothetical protein
VLLTDGRDGLGSLLEHNIRRNAHELRSTSITARTLRWGEDTPPPGPWDLVIGSDVTYHNADDTMDALASTLVSLLCESHRPRVLIAHDHRMREPTDSDRWDEGDENLDRFAAAVERRGLVLDQLEWERPTREERARGRHEVSILEVAQP